jgi:hypothetical protein
MRVLQRHYIPLTLTTFVNCYMRLSLLRLNNQALWLSDKIAMPVLAVKAMSSWTYVVMLGYSSLIARRLMTNQGNSLAWQMGAQRYRLYYWLTYSLASCYTFRSDNR